MQEQKANLGLSAGVELGLALGERRSSLATLLKDFRSYLPLAAQGSFLALHTVTNPSWCYCFTLHPQQVSYLS